MNFIKALSELSILLDWSPEDPLYLRPPSALPNIRPEIISFLNSSGLDKIFKSIPGLTILGSISLPAYYNGKIYDCFPGSWNSAETCKIMKLNHSLIPKHIQIHMNGRVHYLIDPIKSIKQVYSERDLPGGKDEIIEFGMFAAAQGFNPNCLRSDQSALYLVDENKLMFVANEYSVRTRIDEPVKTFSLDLEKYCELKSTKSVELIQSIDMFKGLEFLGIKDESLKSVKTNQPSTFVEYSLPELIPEKLSEQILNDFRYSISYLPDRFNWLEVLMAIASKLPERLASIEPTIENLSKIFLDNLEKFEYVRSPLSFYLNPSEIDQMTDFFFYGDVKNLYQYQTIYDQMKTRNVNRSRGCVNHAYKLAPEKMKYDFIYIRSQAGKRECKEKIQCNQNNESKQNDEYKQNNECEQKTQDNNRWIDLPKFTYKPIHPQVSIKINNIEFNAQTLSKIFFNTPIIQILDSKENVEISWLDKSSLELIQKVIRGELMFYNLYDELSESAYNNLSYRGSLLDLFEYPPMRLQMNLMFVLGKPLVEQIKSSDIGKIDLDIIPEIVKIFS